MARYTYNAGLVTEALDKLYSACDSLDDTNVDMKKGIDMINSARGAENIRVDFTPITGYKSSVIDCIEKMAKEIKGKAQEIEEYEAAPWYQKLFATIGMGALKLLEGIASAGEQIVDGVASIVGFVGGIFSSDLRDCIEEFVKKDWVGDTTAKWYEEGWLKSVNKYSIMSHESTAANVLKGFGVATGYVALSVVTAGAGIGGSAAAAAAGGIGSGTQAGLQAGKTFNQAFGQGVKQGAVAAATTLVIGGVANKLGTLKKGGSAVLNSSDEVTGALVKSSDEVTNALVNSSDEVTNALVNSSDEVTTALANNADEVGNAVANSADDIGNIANSGKHTIGQKINAKFNSGIDKAKGLVDKGLEKAAQTKVGGAIGKGVNKLGTTATNAIATVAGAKAGGNLSSPAQSSAYRVAMKEAGNPSLGQQLAEDSYDKVMDNKPTVKVMDNKPTVKDNSQANSGGIGSGTQAGAGSSSPSGNNGVGNTGGNNGGKPSYKVTGKNPVKLPDYPGENGGNGGNHGGNNFGGNNGNSGNGGNNFGGNNGNSGNGGNNFGGNNGNSGNGGNNGGGNNGNDGAVGRVNITGGNGGGGTGSTHGIKTLGKTTSGKVSSSDVLDTFGAAAGSLSDITGTDTSIPTSSSPILSSDSGSGKSMIPLGAGLGAAALAGIGTKAYLDKKEKKEEDSDELETEEWANQDVEIDYGLETEEADYLDPTDELAFQE